MSSPHDFNIANADGATVRADINLVLAAIRDNSLSSSDLTTSESVAGQFKITDNVLKIRNSSNQAFTDIGNINTANLGLISASGGEMSGVLKISNGNEGAPAISFTTDTDTGLFRDAANVMGFTAGGTESMIFSGDGITLRSQNEIRFGDSDSSNYVGIKAPSTVASNKTITLPDETGTLLTSASTIPSGTIAGLGKSVKDFGATGDGDTDDTAAIQTAVDDLNTTSASRSATLVFPAGTYKITKPIDFALGANTEITGTYTRTGSTVAVTTSSNHNLITGNQVTMSFTGSKTLTITQANITEANPGVFTATSHELLTGDEITYSSNGGTSLVTRTSNTVADGDKLFVIKVDANSFKIASTLSNATAGNALQITNDGNDSQTFVGLKPKDGKYKITKTGDTTFTLTDSVNTPDITSTACTTTIDNFRREIIGSRGTMGVAKILVSFNGYGNTAWNTSTNYTTGNEVTTSAGNSYIATQSIDNTKDEPTHTHGISTDGWQCTSAGAFHFGPVNTGNACEFALSGLFFNGERDTSGNFFRHPPAIEVLGMVQSRMNNIVIQSIQNTAINISSPQNNKIYNVSVWFSGRSFEYKDTGSEGLIDVAKVVANQAQNATAVTIDTDLSINDTPFTSSDLFKTICLWSSSATNEFRQKCKITAVDSSSQVTVDVQQPNIADGELQDKNLIFGSPHITTTSNSTTITADANTFASTDLGAFIWLKIANPTTITPWSSSTDYDTVGTLAKNNGLIYRLTHNVGSGHNAPTHLKNLKDIDAWNSSKAYTTDNLVVNSGNIYKATTSISANTPSGGPTQTDASTSSGWEHIPWDLMEIGLVRRKIVGFTSVTQVTLDQALGATTTTPTTENITCEIAIPAIDINSDHGSGNSSDNKFINLQVESHRGVGVCAEDQSLLDFSGTKIHSEQGSGAILDSATDYSVAALWLHQVDGTYEGSTDGQYIGNNRVYLSGQTAGFILSNFITRTANHEKIIAVDEKNYFFDGASLIIDNMSITGGIADDELKEVVDDFSGTPVGYIFNGSFVNQGSETSGPIIGHITQDAYVKQEGSHASLYLDKGNLVLPDSTASTLGRLIVGTGNDLQIYHDSTDSFIENITGNLHIRPKASEEGIKLIPDGAVELYHDNVLKAQTSSDGFDIPADSTKLKIGQSGDLTFFHDGSNSYVQNHTGDLVLSDTNHTYARGYTSDKSIGLFFNNSRKAQTSANGLDVTGTITATAHIDLPDSTSNAVGRIRLGDGTDMQIFHEGGGGFIGNFTGNLNIHSNGLRLLNGAKTETFISANENGAVELYHDNAKKAETSSLGLDLPSDNNRLRIGASQDLELYHTTSGNSVIKNSTGVLYIAGDDVRIVNSAINESGIKFTANGASTLLHNNSEKLTTTTNGVTVTGTVTETSDIALKENIQPLNNVLDKVKQLTGYQYNFKNSDKTSMGVIAQDVEKVFPELVQGEEGEKSLQYSGLVGALIESVKELSTKVDDLESKLYT